MQHRKGGGVTVARNTGKEESTGFGGVGIGNQGEGRGKDNVKPLNVVVWPGERQHH